MKQALDISVLTLTTLINEAKLNDMEKALLGDTVALLERIGKYPLAFGVKENT